jgi:RNA polymerase subunit RPABC4/transcription elongation factor Spt4
MGTVQNPVDVVTCQWCGALAGINRVMCPICRRRLRPARDLNIAAEGAEPITAPIGPPFLTCPEGHFINDGDQFCPACGIGLVPTAPVAPNTARYVPMDVGSGTRPGVIPGYLCPDLLRRSS